MPAWKPVISGAGQQVTSDVLGKSKTVPVRGTVRSVSLPPLLKCSPPLVKSQGARRSGALALTPCHGTCQGLDACCTLTNLYYGRKVMCATWSKNRTQKKKTKTTESSVLSVSDLSWPSFLWNYVPTQGRVTPWGEMPVQMMPLCCTQEIYQQDPCHKVLVCLSSDPFWMCFQGSWFQNDLCIVWVCFCVAWHSGFLYRQLCRAGKSMWNASYWSHHLANIHLV